MHKWIEWVMEPIKNVHDSDEVDDLSPENLWHAIKETLKRYKEV